MVIGLLKIILYYWFLQSWIFTCFEFMFIYLYNIYLIKFSSIKLEFFKNCIILLMKALSSLSASYRGSGRFNLVFMSVYQ